MESPIIPNHSEDWKLNANVESRIILNKLKIKTPEYGTMEFCRSLTTRSVPTEPRFCHTKHLDFNSKFILDVLLNEFLGLLGKCEEKCEVCEEYVQQLRHHIIQAHTTSPHAQTVTVFKCDICSSIYSSPSMLIRHRNTHSDNSDTLTTPRTYEPEPVRSYSNNIYGSFDISSVSRTNEIVSSGQCENHPQQPFTVPPKSSELYCLKQESSQSPLEISNAQEVNNDLSAMISVNPNPLSVLQHVNHFSAIVKQESDEVDVEYNFSTLAENVKQESNEVEYQYDIEDPLLLPDLQQQAQIPSFIKYECTGISTVSEYKHEDQTIRVTHKKNTNVTHPAKINHKCGSCGKCFSRLQQLTRHKLTHTGEKSFHCDVCGRRFAQGPHLANHKLTHTGAKPHECNQCGKCFGQRFSLTRHKQTHTGEKPFHCDECGRGFQLKRSLALHKLTHTGEKSFHCDVCGRNFAQGHHLANHKLTHTGVRPHKCDVCGKCFTQSSALIRHKLTHTGEKSYRCDVCGKDFALKQNLAVHKLTHTEKNHTHVTYVDRVLNDIHT